MSSRAKEERRADGSILVVARDIGEESQIRSTIINALIAGGLLCLGAGLAAAFGLSMRQMRRIAQIRRVIQRISQGHLAERLSTLVGATNSTCSRISSITCWRKSKAFDERG